MNNKIYLSGHWFMQRTLEVDAAPRQKMWQIEIKMNTQQKKADRVGICYIDCLLTTHSTFQWHTDNFTIMGVKIQPTLSRIFGKQYHYQLCIRLVNAV